MVDPTRCLQLFQLLQKKNKKGKFSPEKYHGYFYQQFDINNATESDAKTHPFPKDFLYNGLDNWVKATKKMDKAIDNGDGVFRDMNIKNVYYDKNSGNTTIAMEEFFQVEKQSKSSYYYVDHHGKISILQLDADGELNWHHEINKDQVGAKFKKQKLFSFVFIENDDNFYILFNDRKANTEKRKKNEKAMKYTGKINSSTAVISYQISNDGKIFKENVLPSPKPLQIYPKNYRLDNNTNILFGITKNKTKIGRVKF